MKFITVFFLVSVFTSFSVVAQRTSLNITPQDIEQIKAKVAQFDFAKERWEQLKTIADSAVADESAIDLPMQGGNWGHFYVDPEEGKPLVPGKYLGNWNWEHHNQAGTKTYLSVDSVKEKNYDGVLILTKVHNEWASKLFSLALAYRMTGNYNYLNRANQILEAYNQIYTKLPLHNKEGNSDPNAEIGVGRISAQALDESVWLIKILQSVSLIWDDMSATQKTELSNKLLFPAADMIKGCYNLGIHNISCWYNAAVGMTGYLTGRKDYIQWALHEKNRGLEFQLAKGFTTEGNWYENAPSYHFYAIHPIIYLAETAKNNGDPTYLTNIKRVFDAPIQLMMPDLYLPRFNDCREVYLPAYKSFYEYGYARFKSPNYLSLIEKGRAYTGTIEKGNKLLSNVNVFDFSLLYGESIPLNVPPIVPQSRHLAGSGFDILTTGKAPITTWLATVYDQNNEHGWHMHPNSLDFVLYGNGEQISMDPGHAEYGAPVHEGWYKTSIAHNVLVVNQKSQDFRKVKSIAFGETKGIHYSMAETDSIYEGIKQTRAYLLVDANTVLIADWISADRISLMDVVYHQRGVWKQKEQGLNWQIPDVVGYKYLKNAEFFSASKNHLFSTLINGKEIVVQTLSSKPVSVITAMGNGQDFEPTPCIISRYNGNQLFMLTVIKLDGSKENVRFKLKNTQAKSPVSITFGKKTVQIDPKGSFVVK